MGKVKEQLLELEDLICLLENGLEDIDIDEVEAINHYIRVHWYEYISYLKKYMPADFIEELAENEEYKKQYITYIFDTMPINAEVIDIKVEIGKYIEKHWEELFPKYI